MNKQSKMTSKEALKEICNKCEEGIVMRGMRCPFRSISNDYCEAYETIEKELKAFEIIKKKKVNVFALYNIYESWDVCEEPYNSILCENERKLTKDEFKLLCETLFDEPKHKDFDAYGQQQCEGDCGC